MILVLQNPTWWFTEVPKAGSTAVSYAIHDSNVEIETPYQKHWPVLPPGWFLETKPKSVISVRNPYSRAVSCWLWCFASGDAAINKSARTGFSAWLDAAAKHNKLHKFAWRQPNTVCLPQAMWLGLQEYDFVLKQETLEADLQDALRSMGATPIAIPQRNTAKSGYFIQGKHGGRRPVHSRHRDYAEQPWQSHYGGQAKQMVEEIWAEDFEALKPHYLEMEKP